MNRRDFIRALGISAATYAFLPTWLMRSTAMAAVTAGPLKIYGSFFIDHGCDVGWALPGRRSADGNTWIPSLPSTVVGSMTSDHTLRATELRNLVQSDGSLSPVWSSQWRNADLLRYLNLITGLDLYYPAAHGLAALGNASSIHATNPFPYGPTIDKVIAQSPIYSPRGAASCRYLNWEGGGAGPYPSMSTELVDPDSLAGPIRTVGWADDPVEVYQALFTAASSSSRNAANQAALDQVLRDLNRLKNHALVGSSDRSALDAHAGRLENLRTTMAALVCAAHPRLAKYNSSTNPSDFIFNPFTYNQDWNYKVTVLNYILDLLAFTASTASSCGRPMIVAMKCWQFAGAPFDQYGDFHQQVPHYVNDNRALEIGGKPTEERRNRLVAAMLPWMRNQVDNVFLGLARRLKEIPNSTGGNLLDESLLNLFHEAGPKTHVQEGLTVATCGGANGRLKTGYWLDCYHPTIPIRRDQAWQFSGDPLVPPGICKAGLPYIHALNTLCQAAGLSPAHYTIPGSAGGYFNYNYADPYSAQRTRPNPAATISWLLNS